MVNLFYECGNGHRAGEPQPASAGGQSDGGDTGYRPPVELSRPRRCAAAGAAGGHRYVRPARRPARGHRPAPPRSGGRQSPRRSPRRGC